MAETCVFATWRGRIAENNWEAGKNSLNPIFLLRFLACWMRRLVCVLPNQVRRFHVCILALLYWNTLADTLGMYPNQSLHGPAVNTRSSDRYPAVNIITSSSSYKIWSYSRGIYHSLWVVHEASSESLQSILEDTCSTTLSASQDSSNFSPKLHVYAVQSNSPRLFWSSNCWWRSVVFRTYLLDSDRIFWTFQLHTSPFTKNVMDSFVTFLIVGSLHDACPPRWSCRQ